MKKLLLILYLLTISACGFHLRGNYTMPSWFDNVYINQQSTPTGLADEIARRLRSKNITVVNHARLAQARLDILSQNFNRTAAVLDTTTGRPSRYRLSYQVAYQLHNIAGGNSINGNVNDMEDYDFDEHNISALDATEAEIRQRLVQNASGEILSDLSRSVR